MKRERDSYNVRINSSLTGNRKEAHLFGLILLCLLSVFVVVRSRHSCWFFGFVHIEREGGVGSPVQTTYLLTGDREMGLTDCQ